MSLNPSRPAGPGSIDRRRPATTPPGTDPRRGGRVVAVVLLVTFALVAAACGGGNKAGPQVFDKTTTPDGQEAPITSPTTAAPKPYEVQYLGQACPFSPDSNHGFTIDCGQLVVPMRRDQPTKKPVFLSVAVIRSSSPTPQPD